MDDKKGLKGRPFGVVAVATMWLKNRLAFLIRASNRSHEHLPNVKKVFLFSIDNPQLSLYFYVVRCVKEAAMRCLGV